MHHSSPVEEPGSQIQEWEKEGAWQPGGSYTWELRCHPLLLMPQSQSRDRIAPGQGLCPVPTPWASVRNCQRAFHPSSHVHRGGHGTQSVGHLARDPHLLGARSDSMMNPRERSVCVLAMASLLEAS